MGDNWAFVKGTVKIIDERIAYPINHVDIECRRDRGTCEYRQIALMLPDENSFAQSYHVAEIADATYRITRWEENQIDAVPLDNRACRTTQFSFNFETTEFFEIARNNTAGDCETSLGVTFPRLDKPRVSQIVDGREIIGAEFKRIRDEVNVLAVVICLARSENGWRRRCSLIDSSRSAWRHRSSQTWTFFGSQTTGVADRKC